MHAKLALMGYHPGDQELSSFMFAMMNGEIKAGDAAAIALGEMPNPLSDDLDAEYDIAHILEGLEQMD